MSDDPLSVLAILLAHLFFLVIALVCFFAWTDNPYTLRKKRYLVLAIVFASPTLIKCLLLIILG